MEEADLSVSSKLIRQVVVVRGEHEERRDPLHEVVQHRVGDGVAVMGACAPPELVEDDEGAAGSVLEDGARL